MNCSDRDHFCWQQLEIQQLYYYNRISIELDYNRGFLGEMAQCQIYSHSLNESLVSSTKGQKLFQMKTQTENPVIFCGYYSGSHLSHSNTCCFEETLSCKVYTFQFASVVCRLHAFPGRSLYRSLTGKRFACKINLQASISPLRVITWQMHPQNPHTHLFPRTGASTVLNHH